MDDSIWSQAEKEKARQQEHFTSLTDKQKLNYLVEAYDSLMLFLSKEPALTQVQWSLIERVRINIKALI